MKKTEIKVGIKTIEDLADYFGHELYRSLNGAIKDSVFCLDVGLGSAVEDRIVDISMALESIAESFKKIADSIEKKSKP